MIVSSEQQMVQLGHDLAQKLKGSPCLIVLRGELGAGKTTLVRGFLQGMGHQGAVKSPTYTLVEPYELADSMVYHFDLYRIKDPEELEYLGFREYLTSGGFCLIEWPENAGAMMPKEDIEVVITHRNNNREVIINDHQNLL